MEEFIIADDINLVYVQAVSFPMGVGGAYGQLYKGLPNGGRGRMPYGVSYPDKSHTIIYRAGVAELYAGEGKELGMETFLVRKGRYISTYITHWNQDEKSVSRAFEQLLKHPNIDPKGYCLEIYENPNDVRCLVPLV